MVTKVKAEYENCVDQPRKLGSNGSPPRIKIANAITTLKSSLVGRDDEVDLLFTALMAGEHAFLWGSPGTAKSFLADGVARFIDGPKFSYLLTKFTDPAELLGPTDLVKLKSGEYTRVYGGMLPTAYLAFLDEIFKGSSAILNCLLTLVNERIIKFGREEVKCPLVMLIGASNEVPNEQEELGALWDRLVLRKYVRPVSKQAGRKELFKRAAAHSLKAPVFSEKITTAELDIARQEAMSIEWSEAANRAIWQISEELDKEGIDPGDRRWTKSFDIGRAAAYLDGASEVQPEHLEVLQHVLWVDPMEQPGKAAKIITRIANPDGAVITEKLVQVEDIMAKSSEVESVPKLQDVMKDLEKLKDSPRRNKAISYVRDCTQRMYRKVIGLREED